MCQDRKLCNQHGALAVPLSGKMWCPLWITAVLLTVAESHFLLNYPPSIGFSNDNESTAPCGGHNLVFNNVTAPSVNVRVNGFTIELLSTNPQAKWLMRATLSRSTPFNWTDLLPVTSETGNGDFCVPDLALPLEFAGEAGVIQVVQDVMGLVTYQVSRPSSLASISADLRPQCAIVNFEVDANATRSPACTDQTGLTVTLTNSTNLTPDFGNASTTITSSVDFRPSVTPSPSSSTKSVTETPSLQSQADRATVACLGLGVVCLTFAASL